MSERKYSLYHLFLLLVVLAVWIWAAVSPLQKSTWFLENLLVFIFVPAIILLGIYFKLSNLSYTLIAIFIILHLIGSHYTYAQVPFGYILQEFFNSSRNLYDRAVHFAFGLLLAYPIREIFIRITKVKGFWGYYLPLDVALAFSASYEIIEWLAAITVDPASGLAFLGSQGDIWDAQKDMLMAGTGAFISMFFTALINLLLNKNFFKELKEGFKIDEEPLGEKRIKKLLTKR